MVDENEAHRAGRERYEMCTVHPLCPAFISIVIDQTQIRLVNQRGRVERLSGSTTAQALTGGATQLLISRCKEAAESLLIALAGRAQEASVF
jgi:hypothetical protein